jgi:hypothetical protein
METSPPSPSVTPKSPRIIVSFEFLRFFIVIFILGSLFLGVPYGLRLYRNSWAAPGLHPETALTGEWVGILKPPSRPAPPDLSPNPFVAESDRQEAIRELRQQKQDDFDNVRAIFVSTSLDPFHIASASLRGSVTMCGRDGKLISYAFTTNRVSNAGMSLILYNDTQSQFGNLDATLNGSVLAADYHGFEPYLLGDLRRGSRQDFEQACSSLTASAQQPAQ